MFCIGVSLFNTTFTVNDYKANSAMWHSFAIKLVMKTELRRTIHADNKTTIGIQRSDQRLIIAMPVSTTTAPAIRRAR